MINHGDYYLVYVKIAERFELFLDKFNCKTKDTTFVTNLRQMRNDFRNASRHWKIRGCKNSILRVQKNSWMKSWYERKGYVEYADDKESADNIWMKKD